MVYGHSNKSLMAILTLRPISKIIVVDSLWRLRTYVATCSWPHMVPSHWTGHRSNQKVIGYLHSVCSIIISEGIYSQVRSVIFVACRLIVYIASSRSVKAIPVGMVLQGNSPLDFSMYITEICCVFKNRILPSSYGSKQDQWPLLLMFEVLCQHAGK